VESGRTSTADCAVRLELIGGLEVYRLGERVRVSNAKAAAILAYLSLMERPAASREHLAGLLWSDRPEEQARASLRQCVRHLNRLFESTGSLAFNADRAVLALSPGSVRTDVHDLLQGLDSREFGAHLNLPSPRLDELLLGHEDLDEVFRSWLLIKRQGLQDQVVRRLEAIIADLSRGAETLRFAAEQIIAIDPTHERAYQVLIAYHADRGNSATALRLYNTLWQVLEDEHDVEPSRETQEIVVRIKSGTDETGRAPASDIAAAALKPLRDIAVRLPVIGVNPFLPVGTAEESRALVEGIRRELIATLVRFREWVVVEGTGENPLIVPPNGTLGTGDVDYVLHGSFYNRGQDCHLTITLMEWRTRRYLWSEQFALELRNWPSAQQAIVRRMAVAMNVYLSANRTFDQISRGHSGTDIYGLWLRGQSLSLFWEPSRRAEAESLFREIIRRDPTFAPAHSSLAAIYNSRHIVEPGTFRAPTLEHEAAQHATRGVELDPLDTRGQLALAWSNAMRGRFEPAILHYEMAYDLNPNSPQTLMSCAQGLAFCGEYDLAQRLCRHSIELNPAIPPYHWVYSATIHFLSGKYAACIEAAERSRNAIATVSAFKAAALAHLGAAAEAREAAAFFLEDVRVKWVGQSRATDEQIVAWYLQNFPIRDRDAYERLREGLRLTGLPVD
jgi:DNA-binding SARP family transcriptional activator/TolB-like protein